MWSLTIKKFFSIRRKVLPDADLYFAMG